MTANPGNVEPLEHLGREIMKYWLEYENYVKENREAHRKDPDEAPPSSHTLHLGDMGSTSILLVFVPQNRLSKLSRKQKGYLLQGINESIEDSLERMIDS